MAKYSEETYVRIFDALLSEELLYNSSAASEATIFTAIKRVLGHALKTGYILLYYDLALDPELGVHFKIKDPDGDIIKINLVCENK